MRALDRGEEFLITRNGTPVGVLRPHQQRFFDVEDARRRLESLKSIDYDGLRRDLDAVVDQEMI